ncbi:MAG: hypothetical protein C0623_07450 [Desulfuromonas sp.]|nr:MAG: hypothetical protein C0623_07450 [Desulfuromonas sp.]
MLLKKYLSEHQKIFIRALHEESEKERFDALTCYLISHEGNYLDLSIPYGASPEESYPFDAEKKLEIFSDSMGVGIRLTGRFEKYLQNGVVRILHNNDLQLIHRRIEERRSETLNLGYTKGKGKLRTFRKQWEKNTKILENLEDFSKLPQFPKVNVNISMTGVGFKIKTPIEVSDLCLLFIDLDDGKPPVCTMTEVVWRSEEESDGRCMAGFQFLNILENDRKRIKRFVRTASQGQQNKA